MRTLVNVITGFIAVWGNTPGMGNAFGSFDVTIPSLMHLPEQQMKKPFGIVAVISKD